MQSAELQTLEFHPVEFYDMAMQDRVFDQHVLERSKRNLLALHSRAHGHVGATSEASLASMCPTEDNANPNSKASASCQLPSNGSGSGTSTRTSSGCYQKGDTKGASSKNLGPGAHHEPRQQGSKIGANTMAVLRDPLSHEAALQRSRSVESPSSTTKTENPAMVTRMLQQLRPLMGEFKPNAAICLAMQKKIDAEETLMVAIQKEVEIQQSTSHAYTQRQSQVRQGHLRLRCLRAHIGVWWRKASTRTSCTST